MKKLLATTAVSLALASGYAGQVIASETPVSITYNADDYTQLVVSRIALKSEKSMYLGDFQQAERRKIPTKLYAGWGSVKMGSINALAC